MRKIIIVLAVMVFGVTGCGDNTNNTQTYYEQTYYGNGVLKIKDAQMWLRNYSTNRLSQAYEKLIENEYNIIVKREYNEETDDDDDADQEIGEGAINGGKLSFTVDVPDNLLGWDKLKVFFNVIVEGEGWDVAIDVKTTEGTFIQLTTNEDEYVLTREGLSGTTSSLSDETVFFIYVDGGCTITGGPQEDERVMYTFNPFTLKLKKGWNTIWYKQTYTSSGRSSFFMDVKNPDLKWVLVPNVPTK
jgi:hypothetical protein